MTDDAADAHDTDDAGTVDDADGASGARPGGRTCQMCGASLYRRHCKYVCPNHGVVMDCADTFHLQRE
jgi:uncharacterized Zn finger protein (UPF0148 family)